MQVRSVSFYKKIGIDIEVLASEYDIEIYDESTVSE